MAEKTKKFPYTPEELEEKILEYETVCATKKVFADVAGMRVYCKITRKDIAEITADGYPKAEEYMSVLERAADRRESSLMRRMVTEPKSANGCMNALKQKDNGGYTDKPAVDNTEKTLNIKIVGGHGMELFK